MKNNLKNNSQGFTLVELMIALLVFAVGILAVAGLQVTSIRYNADAQRTSEASMFAQSKMEELMVMNYDAVVDSIAAETEGIYSVTWSVVDDTPRTGAKEISVTVNWTSRGVNKTTTLNCIRAELK